MAKLGGAFPGLGWLKKDLEVIESMALNDQCHLSSRMEFASCNYNFKGDRQLVVEYYQTNHQSYLSVILNYQSY